MAYMQRAPIVICALLAAGLSSALADPLPRQAVVEDLTYFRDQWAPKDRSYSPQARKMMQAFITDAIDHAQPMEKADLALVFAQAEALADNPHTYSDFFNEDGLFHNLPISFWNFAEGPVVTRAHPQYERLLGARILKIGGVPWAEAARRVDKFIPGPRARKHYLEPSWLTRIEVLESVGLAKDGACTITVALSSGEVSDATLGATPTPDPAGHSPGWRASLVPGKGPEPWPHVLDRLKTVPLAFAPPDEFTATPLNDGAVSYIRSNRLSPYEGEMTVMIKAYGIIDGLVKQPKLPHDIIVDLRYNEGGNFFNIIAFSKELAQIVKPDGHIYVIEGRATFSAAIVFMALLKSEAAGHVTLVGEPASDNPWFWSEGQTLTTPAGKLPLRYNTGFHDWAHGCTDLTKCYWPVVFHGAAVGSLKPDIAVTMRYADYAQGKDTALDRILADIAHRAGSKTDMQDHR